MITSVPSDLQSGRTFGWMNALGRHIGLLLLATFFLASCTQDEIITPTTPPAVPQGMKTLTVDFQLPEGKPGFDGQMTGTRGEMREESALCSLHSALSTRSEAASSWAEGDELMMSVAVADAEYDAMGVVLTLKCDENGIWDVLTDKSYSAIAQGGNQTIKPYAELPLLAEVTDLTLSEGFTLMVDEAMGEVMTHMVEFYYAPEMEWTFDGALWGFVPKDDATTTAPEKWTANYKYNVAAGEKYEPMWETNTARLRIYTGAKGDEVTLSSVSFHPRNVGSSANYTYTATTDADGYACFYGTLDCGPDANGNRVPVTSGFNVSLTAVTVGEGEAAFTCPVSPVTLLEASALVPVKLDAGESYRLDATAKRAAAADGIAVIDGTCGGETTGDDTDVAAVRTQLETCLAEGKTTIVVTGASLAAYSGSYAETVVGEAIRLLTMNQDGSSNTSSPYIGTIDLVLPDATSIGDKAFYNCKVLTSVSLPAATSIGNYVFKDCTALTSVSLPSATSIGLHAFYGCSALTNVSLPLGTSIGESAFYNCSALTSVSAPLATSIGNSAFYYCTALTSVSLPAATSIRSYAFSYCSALTSVSAPLATSIDNYAFYNCNSLTSLTFGKVVSVGDYAFDGTLSDGSDWTTQCALTLHIDQLSSTDLAPSGNTWAGKTWASISYVDDEGNAVDASKVVVIDGTSDDLETVKTAISGKSIIYVKGATLAADATGNIAETIVGVAISQLPSGTTISLVLPDVTEIGEYAFYGCTALTSVSAPAATSIEQSAFSGCKAITSVSASEATSIESFTFYNCSALESVSLPSAASIGIKAFADCTALTNLTFGTVTSVNTESGYHSFEDATPENCHLTLGSGTTAGYLDVANKTWAGMTWASITLK